MIQKAFHIVRESGLRELGNRALALAYRRGLRPLLPSAGPVSYAGIPVAHYRKWGDRTVPSRWRPTSVQDVPGYEAALVAAIEEYTRTGDQVVVIGGGLGVTAAIAALKAGANGRVRCFEGASQGVALVQRTARLNGVADRLTVHHAVVARSIAVYGTQPNGEVVLPEELPECDILELDCEGAEVDILRAMTIRPRAVLVETHGLYGASTPLVADLLNERGYSVSHRGVAEPRFSTVCEENDIRVLVGVRNDALCPA